MLWYPCRLRSPTVVENGLLPQSYTSIRNHVFESSVLLKGREFRGDLALGEALNPRAAEFSIVFLHCRQTGRFWLIRLGRFFVRRVFAVFVHFGARLVVD